MNGWAGVLGIEFRTLYLADFGGMNPSLHDGDDLACLCAARDGAAGLFCFSQLIAVERVVWLAGVFERERPSVG
jgi:hypothetical protein